MDFLNKAKETIVTAGRDISQKASDTNEFAKISNKMKELDKRYYDALKEIGEKLIDSPIAAETCPELVEEIKANRAEYELAKIDTVILKGKKICPQCGAEQDKAVSFCNACGFNIADVVMVGSKPEVPTCKKCGKEIIPGTKFCSGCGSPIEVEEANAAEQPQQTPIAPDDNLL